MTMTANDAQRNILVVDDEPQITRVLRTALSGQGYKVRTAGDGDEALEVMRQWTPDLVITDLSMPNMGGLELCRRIRSKSSVPIIVLSVRGGEKPKVEALDSGADDYVTKPFNMNELVARVRAGLRRASGPTREEEKKLAGVIEVGDFNINLLTRLVTVRGRGVRLTPKEFDLLCYLAKNPGRVITHGTLLTSVWGETENQQPEYLHVFINHLRKKLEPEDGSVHYIVTEKWVGYRFEPGAPRNDSGTVSY
jgi:two-component system KDP operon response regulator KdpE